MQRPFVIAICSAFLVSCAEPTAPGDVAKAPDVKRTIVDGRNGGVTGFYFLPPLAARVNYSGEFDPARNPAVDVCSVTAGECVTTVAHFTMQSGQGPSRIRISQTDETYSVEWQTKADGLATGTYRVNVFDGAVLLGYADVVLVNRSSEARSVPAGTASLVLGSTLPIKFRLEKTISGNVARLEIYPSAFLLPGQGTTHALAVRAYDADGNPVVPGPIAWHTNNPATIDVSPAGVASAAASSGSAQITATVGGVTSPPALGLVSTVAPGAFIVHDENVVTPPVALASRYSAAVSPMQNVQIVPVDSAAPYGPGWRYKVYLTGPVPAAGQIMVSDGESPIGGRVVGVTPLAGMSEVTLELVSIPEMLPGLNVDEEMPIDSTFVDKLPTGSITSLVSTGNSFGFAKDLRYPTRFSLLESETEFQLGPFECKLKTGGDPFQPDISNVSFHASPQFIIHFAYSSANGFQKLVFEGNVDAGITAKAVFNLAVEGSLECEVQLATVHLPIGGPLALIIGGSIPVGVGFSSEVKLNNGGYGIDIGPTFGLSMALGIDCTSVCGLVADMDGSHGGYMTPVIADFSNAAKNEMSATGYGFAKFDIGNGFLQALQFEAVRAQAGLKQAFQLASKEIQSNDSAYASNFKLSFDIEAGTGSSVEKVAQLLSIVLPPLKVEKSFALAESPRLVSFTISPSRVRAISPNDTDQKASFILNLDPVTYLGGYAIDHIELFRRKTNAANQDSLSSLPAPCNAIPAASGQSLFECQAALPKSWAGEQTVFAFVQPKLFGSTLPVLLELSEDAKAKITVDTALVTVSPSSATVGTGETVQFSASVQGMSSGDVTWSASGGTVSSSGLFTAGSSPGTFSVTATSNVDQSVKGTATVTVLATRSVVVTPGSVNVSFGQTQQFQASVTGMSSSAVTWSASGGTISSTGLFTADTVAGTFAIAATSVEDPSVSGTALVYIGSGQAANVVVTGRRCSNSGAVQLQLDPYTTANVGFDNDVDTLGLNAYSNSQTTPPANISSDAGTMSGSADGSVNSSVQADAGTNVVRSGTLSMTSHGNVTANLTNPDPRYSPGGTAGVMSSCAVIIEVKSDSAWIDVSASMSRSGDSKNGSGYVAISGPADALPLHIFIAVNSSENPSYSGTLTLMKGQWVLSVMTQAGPILSSLTSSATSEETMSGSLTFSLRGP